MQVVGFPPGACLSRGPAGSPVPRMPVGGVHGVGFGMVPWNRRRAGTNRNGTESQPEPAQTRRKHRRMRTAVGLGALVSARQHCLPAYEGSVEEMRVGKPGTLTCEASDRKIRTRERGRKWWFPLDRRRKRGREERPVAAGAVEGAAMGLATPCRPGHVAASLFAKRKQAGWLFSKWGSFENSIQANRQMLFELVRPRAANLHRPAFLPCPCGRRTRIVPIITTCRTAMPSRRVHFPTSRRGRAGEPTSTGKTRDAACVFAEGRLRHLGQDLWAARDVGISKNTVLEIVKRCRHGG